MSEPHKRALIAAYYLSRFDRKGVRALGYETFAQAFSEIGSALGVKPSTVKQMRDGFDPYCSQVRVGYYQRQILRSRANVIEAYADLGEAAMSGIVREILQGGPQATCAYVAAISDVLESEEKVPTDNTPFATRLQTGEKAETFFQEQFPHLADFKGSSLEDTRKFGIGFDFRAVFPDSYKVFEVKGVREPHGYISFTDKEWSVAKVMEQGYILALVRSLDTVPTLSLISNPAQILAVNMRTIQSVAVSWNAKV